jgi:hypothetical protein
MPSRAADFFARTGGTARQLNQTSAPREGTIMRLIDGTSPRTETGTASNAGSVWRSIAMPALPPSRRERESRASRFASRVLAPTFAQRILAPAGGPALLAAPGRNRG